MHWKAQRYLITVLMLTTITLHEMARLAESAVKDRKLFDLQQLELCMCLNYIQRNTRHKRDQHTQ